MRANSVALPLFNIADQRERNIDEEIQKGGKKLGKEQKKRYSVCAAIMSLDCAISLIF